MGLERRYVATCDTCFDVSDGFADSVDGMLAELSGSSWVVRGRGRRRRIYCSPDCETHSERPLFHAYGPIRGGCGHRHLTIDTARECVTADMRHCGVHGGYTDRYVAPLNAAAEAMLDPDTERAIDHKLSEES